MAGTRTPGSRTIVGDGSFGTVAGSRSVGTRTVAGTRSTAGAGTASHIPGHRDGNVFYRHNGHSGHGHVDPYHDHYHDGYYHDHYHDDWWWGFGIGIGVGWGLGYWWDPWYYNAYSPYWVGGVPAYGYGVVAYEPYYAPSAPMVVDPGYMGPAAPGVVVPPAAPAAPEEGAAPPPPAPEPEAATPPAADDPEMEKARAEFKAAHDAFLGARYEEALGKFRAMTAADAANGEAWLGRAHASFALGLYGESAHAVGQAAELGAFPRGYRFNPTPLYPAQGSFDEKLQTLQTWTREHPDDADAQIVLAWMLVSMAKPAEARAVISGLEAIRPDDPTAAYLRVALLPPEKEAAPEGSATPRPVAPPPPSTPPHPTK